MKEGGEVEIKMLDKRRYQIMFKKIDQLGFIKGAKKYFKTSVLNPVLALGLLFALLVCSWFYLSDPNKINRQEELQHSLLKSRFKEALSELIEKKHPEVNKISFNKLWTKKTEEAGLVEIYFNYSLNLEDGDTDLEGSALLSLSEEDIWQIQNFQVEKSSFDFSEPLTIKASPLIDQNKE